MKLYILVLEVEPIGSEPFREWPLHCTLAHWFEYDGQIEKLSRSLKEFFENYNAPELRGGESAIFGPKHNLPVTLVENTKEVQNLHNSTVDKLEEMGVIFPHERFMRNGYRPHVTEHGGRKLHKKEIHISEAVYLVESISESPKVRQVVERFNLSKKVIQ